MELEKEASNEGPILSEVQNTDESVSKIKDVANVIEEAKLPVENSSTADVSEIPVNQDSNDKIASDMHQELSEKAQSNSEASKIHSSVITENIELEPKQETTANPDIISDAHVSNQIAYSERKPVTMCSDLNANHVVDFLHTELEAISTENNDLKSNADVDQQRISESTMPIIERTNNIQASIENSEIKQDEVKKPDESKDTVTEQKPSIESVQADDKPEGIFLETTNDATNITHEEEERENGEDEAEPAEEKATNETSESLVQIENQTPIASTDVSTIKVEDQSTSHATPKVTKKKAKSSTPNKHSVNDSHASQKRRKKDPAAPKAPLNGYLVYFNDERADMRMKNPNMGFGELTKIIALKWKDLPAEEKQKFITEADLDKERYVKEMTEYKKSESYKNYVKETSQAKLARNDEMMNNSLQNDGLGPMSAPNSFSIANESNVAGFDIPIFTEEFIEHSKSRENEMRLVRKEITELEQQNSVLHKHIEIMKQSSTKLDADIDQLQNSNNQVKKKMDTFRQTIINCNIQLPNTLEYPTPNNIDDYIMRLYSLIANNNASANQNDLAFANHVKSVLTKINFNNLFE